ncbi:uncharacterized protein LOC123872791 isoform X1 [Maniola jurtina]|uniref:uncharacterized protein LOC123872791 isoform X1 n=1 Tax=Maniola jurtina TaxID=191418 RepID=UPI001E688B85|nr:uncharacterized protein LOC123872791 isoform X1 [Maniola jurtina]XP_045773274.1 uncharacterized protein LOC123872791 isoform X1 [Maniola jurtina]XP_045773275.1 uncharacterized protein LOC123872791 isoform X1 [Maniola jurtina]XP_045773276.1 uncharacterized protein LOC123872791 isoform X1 [Maniola jurtina]XP_045773277.1 uncharacterized protein LOC123872791 isoform X1 [Maniola jurtina]
MESDDLDTYIVVVGDDIESFPECLQKVEEGVYPVSEDLLEEPREESNLENPRPIKHESENENNDMEVEVPPKENIEVEFLSDDAELSDDGAKVPQTKMGLRSRTRKRTPAERHSYVKSIKKLHPELRKSKKLLIDSLVAIMKETKPPPLPKDYFMMDGIMFQCIKCSHQSESMAAAGRHYQEKHGERYLYCLACGVNFRSKTNLYKHEKSCEAEDAALVLRARADFLGNRAGARPFAPQRAPSAKRKKSPKKTLPATPVKPPIRKYGTKSNYSADALEEALKRIRNRKMAVSDASLIYKIPLSTLHFKLKNTHSNTYGRPTVFSADEEKTIETHLCAISDCGVPMRELDVRKIIQAYLNSNDREVDIFRNNLPGKDWAKSILNRYEDLRTRVQRNYMTRGMRVDAHAINEFFVDLECELRGVPAANIYSFAEAHLLDDLKKRKVVLARDSRHPNVPTVKPSLTAVFCGNAEGTMLPPFLIFQGDDSEPGWVACAPRGSNVVATHSGWLDFASFELWFKTTFLPRVTKRKGKKILIGDCLSSQLTIGAIKLCNQKNIKFVCPPPNWGPLVQPIVAGYFDALETHWRREVEEWRNSFKGEPDYALGSSLVQLLTQTFNTNTETISKSLKAGFEVCGIHPINREKVLERLSQYLKSHPRRAHL